MRRYISIILAIVFMVNCVCITPLKAQPISLPAPGSMVPLSDAFNPTLLKGIKVNPDNPFNFEFVLSHSDSTSAVASAKVDALKSESTKLIKYFLAALTTPEKDMWVNLSPYEKDRIVPESFGQTEMGRDLLAQDYLLKQITASLVYPESEIGKLYWKKVYELSDNKNIPIKTFNKVWIVPGKAVIYENPKNGTAYIVESNLKVMTEQDYFAVEKNQRLPGDIFPTEMCPQAGLPAGQAGCQATIGLNLKASQGNAQSQAHASQVVRDIVIPQLTKEVNEGKNFVQLRQIYNSLILASWYKKRIKESILTQAYVDKDKILGVHIDDSNEKQYIYEQYLQAFKKGAYNYIKNDVGLNGESVPRKYFSGGATFLGATNNIEIIHSLNNAMMTPPKDPFKIEVKLDNSKSSGVNGKDKQKITLKKASARIVAAIVNSVSNGFYNFRDYFSPNYDLRQSVERTELKDLIRVSELKKALKGLKTAYYAGIGNDVGSLFSVLNVETIAAVDPLLMGYTLNHEKEIIEKYSQEIINLGGEFLKIEQTVFHGQVPRVSFKFTYKGKARTLVLYRGDANILTPDVLPETSMGYDLYYTRALQSKAVSFNEIVEQIYHPLMRNGIIVVDEVQGSEKFYRDGLETLYKSSQSNQAPQMVLQKRLLLKEKNLSRIAERFIGDEDDSDFGMGATQLSSYKNVFNLNDVDRRLPKYDDFLEIYEIWMKDLMQSARKIQNPIFLLGGDVGAGKTTMARFFKRYLEEHGQSAVAIYTDEFVNNRIFRFQLLSRSLLSDVFFINSQKKINFIKRIFNETPYQETFWEQLKSLESAEKGSAYLDLPSQRIVVHPGDIIIMEGPHTMGLFPELKPTKGVLFQIDPKIQSWRITKRIMEAKGESYIYANFKAKLPYARNLHELVTEGVELYDYFINIDTEGHLTMSKKIGVNSQLTQLTLGEDREMKTESQEELSWEEGNRLIQEIYATKNKFKTYGDGKEALNGFEHIIIGELDALESFFTGAKFDLKRYSMVLRTLDTLDQLFVQFSDFKKQVELSQWAETFLKEYNIKTGKLENLRLLALEIQSGKFTQELADVILSMKTVFDGNSIRIAEISEYFMNKQGTMDETGDSAQIVDKGGIDFNADKISVEIRTGSPDMPAGLQVKDFGDDSGINFKIDPAMLKVLQSAQGLTPFIVSIQPMTDIKQFIGL